MARVIDDAVTFSKNMLRLSVDPGAENPTGKDKRGKTNSLNLSVAAQFPWLQQAFPTAMIVPTQDALTCSLPTSSDNLKSNNPFPQGYTTITSELERDEQRTRPLDDILPQSFATRSISCRRYRGLRR
jgi:hypothetical protein